MPKVSIILPTYNRAFYLEDSLKSIFQQDFEDFEIILVDNNSTDSTYNVADKYSGDKRLRYFKNNLNIGAIENHNKALQYISGEYIAMFSDDDIMLQSSLKKRVEVLDNFKDVVLVHTSLNTIDENNLITQKGHWDKDLYTNFKIDTGLMNRNLLQSILIKKWNFISMPTVLVRTEVLSQNNLSFNTSLKYFGDWDLWLKLSELGIFYFINEELTNYRKHSKNETKSISANVALTELILMKLSFYNKFRELELNELEIEKIFKETIKQVNKAYSLTTFSDRIIRRIFRRKENHNIVF